MATATLFELEQELLTWIKEVPAFTDNAYSIFSIDDLMTRLTLGGYPIVGVGYNGTAPVEGANDARPVSAGATGLVLVDAQFVVLIGIQYQHAGQEDNKKSATDLLDETRSAILGRKGVNTRPWRFIGERPEPDATADGVVFYSQVWHTSLPVSGKF